MGGDGQVSLGPTIVKQTARKVRKVHHDRALAGFAGTAADAFTLFERFEAKLEEHRGNLRRAAVELAKEWRTDRVLRRLEALLRQDFDGDPAGRRDRAVLETLYATGVRVAELAGLDLGDVDLREGGVRVRGKGGKERIVPLGGKAMAALHAYLGPFRQLCRLIQYDCPILYVSANDHDCLLSNELYQGYSRPMLGGQHLP